MRMPKEVMDTARVVGAARGISASEALSVAWRQYLADHREEMSKEFEEAKRKLKSKPYPDGGRTYA